jgi:benzylsuccinate CoA-transferase BbsF subunit
MAQVEMALQFLTPQLLDYQVNGVVAGPSGNKSAWFAPHGMYPCIGEDRWIALAVESDDEWARLRTAMGDPEWASAYRYATTEGRLAGQAELDEHLCAWTATFEPYPLFELLQRHGVRAGVAQKPSDLFDDPQLAHRQHFLDLEGGEMGRVGYNTSSFRLSATPGWPWRGTPDLGEHTEQVLTELLGYSAEEVAELTEQGALY